MFRKNKIIRDTAMLTAMQLTLDTVSLLLNVFITKRLGTSAMGIFSLMGSFLGLAGILSNGNAFLCTSRLVAEEIGRKDSDPEKVLFYGIKLCGLLSISVSVFLLLFAETVCNRFFSGLNISETVKIMPLALVSGAAAACIKGYFNACRCSGITAAGDILEFSVKSLVTVVLTFFSAADEAAICRIMIISIISGNISSLLFLGVSYIRRHIKSENRCSITFREYAAAAFPIMGGSLLTSVLSSTNDALIPFCLRQYGDSAEKAMSLFGIFEAIVIPSLFFPSVVLCSVSGIIISESARASASKNTGRIKSITSRLIEYTMIYSVFAAAVLMRFGIPLGEILGGGEQAGKMISAIAPVVPFIYMEIILESLIKGMGLQGFSSVNYLAEYVIRISIVLIFVPKTGFTGIAISYYASNVIGNCSRLIKILVHTGVRFKFFRMAGMPVMYSFLTLNFVSLIFKMLKIETNGICKMVFFVALWLVLYAGIYAVLLKLRRGDNSKDKIFVHNKQIST